MSRVNHCIAHFPYNGHLEKRTSLVSSHSDGLLQTIPFNTHNNPSSFS